MASYNVFATNVIVFGETGEGKSAFCISMIRNYFKKGLKVATNFEIYPEHLVNPTSRYTHIRLPELPTSEDLRAVGRGSESKDPNTFGLIILDEAPSFLNNRKWNEKGRDELIVWFRHARKYGWRVVLLAQKADSIDPQIRQAAFPESAQCRRFDTVNIPFVPFKLPRFHMALFRYGYGKLAPVVRRKFYFSKGLQDAYDTNQDFSYNSVGIHSVLSAWHVKGRYMKAFDIWKGAIIATGIFALFLGASGGYLFGVYKRPPDIAPEAVNQLTIDKNVKVTGYVAGAQIHVFTSDGRRLLASRQRVDTTGTYFLVGNTWIQAE